MTNLEASLSEIETELYAAHKHTLGARAKIARNIVDRFEDIADALESEYLREQRQEAAHERHLEQLRSE